ncbi:MAG: flippase [Candidatus Staskawiczbacteria bacterium]|nr:flippase [Candidatus Staskawiczbacteria bacterium]
MPQIFKAFFLNNLGVGQTIIKNTFWLTLGEITVRIFGFAVAIYVARTLGATEYGKFIFAFSFVYLMSIFSNLGVIDISTRELSRSRDNEKKFNSFFTLGVFLCLLVLILTCVISFFITPDPTIRAMIGILSFSMLSASLFEITFSFLRARQKMEYEASIKIFQAIVNTVAVLFIIFNIPSGVNLSYAYMASNLMVMIVVLFMFHAFVHRLMFVWDRRSLNFLKISWPLSLGFTTTWLYVLITSIMLGLLGLNTENGWYSAASKIALAAMIPADLMIRGFYPSLSNFFLSSRDRFHVIWGYFVQTMVSSALPIIVGGVVVAPGVIDFFYGSGFAPSVFSFQLLSVVVGVAFITCPYGLLLIVSDHQDKNFFLVIMGVVVDIILNLLLIPWYGFYGAIISTIIASLLVLFGTIIVLKRFSAFILFDKKLAKMTLISLVSVTVMYFCITLPSVYGLNVFLVIFMGGLVYCGTFFLLYRLTFLKK